MVPGRLLTLYCAQGSLMNKLYAHGFRCFDQNRSLVWRATLSQASVAASFLYRSAWQLGRIRRYPICPQICNFNNIVISIPHDQFHSYRRETGVIINLWSSWNLKGESVILEIAEPQHKFYLVKNWVAGGLVCKSSRWWEENFVV